MFDFSHADWSASIGGGLRFGGLLIEPSGTASFNGNRFEALQLVLSFTPGVDQSVPEECRHRPGPDAPPTRGDPGGGGQICAGVDCHRPPTPANFVAHQVCCLRPHAPEGPHTPAGLPPRTVYFFYDTPILKPGGMDILGQVVDALRLFPTLRIRITGHTSREGTEAYNLRLSDRRAQAARDLVSIRGIDASRIMVLAMGEYAPAVTEPPEPPPGALRMPAGEAIRDLNRRAEIAFFDPTGTVPGVPVLPPVNLTVPSSFPRLGAIRPGLMDSGLTLSQPGGG